jgi:hypothetical protein
MAASGVQVGPPHLASQYSGHGLSTPQASWAKRRSSAGSSLARERLGQRGFNGVASVPKAGVGHEMVDAIQQG